MKTTIIHILCTCALICGFALARTHSAQAAAVIPSAVFDRITDTKATRHNWNLARDYELQMRYELARQHYLLALASCRSESTQAQLKRELESIDLQIRTMR
ncbi:MAG: hypothetical protein LBH94_00210 [Deltaproteobacteria bacterium]|jgi:hypothetical protein|nr:hypothetical protein [Deltaproteobacteria bacterium]